MIFSLGIGIAAFGAYLGSRLPDWFATHHPDFLGLKPDQLVLLLASGITCFGLVPLRHLSLGALPPPKQGRIVRSSFLVRFLPAVAAWSLVTGSFSPLANIYFSQHLHMSIPQIGTVFSISQITQLASVLGAPILLNKLGLIGGTVSTQLGAAIMLAELASVGQPLLASFTYVAFTAFQWMNEPGLYSLVMNRVSDEERSGASAYMNLTIAAFQAIAALVAGQAFEAYGYPAVLRAIALVAVVAAAALWSVPTNVPAPQAEAGD